MTRAEAKLAVRQIGHLVRRIHLVTEAVILQWVEDIRSARGLPSDPAAHERLEALHRRIDRGMPRS